MILCFSDAMDLISPAIVDHHKRVAYIAFRIANEMGMPVKLQSDLLLAGALHDIGALSLKERLDNLDFETDNPHGHAKVGYSLLKNFERFAHISKTIRYHHVCWDEVDNNSFCKKDVPISSYILHLADRISVLIKPNEDVLGQVKEITDIINRNSGRMFKPDMVEAFNRLALREYFWLDIVSPSINSILGHLSTQVSIELDLESLNQLAKMFCQIIDFRSRFTATHSSGVAVCARMLGRLIGFSERECKMIGISGYLHDLGKLAVPSEILEKPDKLTVEEMNIIKGHTYHTYRVLEPIKGLDIINAWASFHHERLDGRGYPFHHKGEDLVLGARILAVADTFTAITEDRPYRKGMDSDRALKVLQDMAGNKALDQNIVSMLKVNYGIIDKARKKAQEEARRNYEKFWNRIK
jgi:putative nucleotidyltransferase with HDIG domain